ncbi:CAP domain-containing protein [Streptomyces sp. NPDC046876]|uniref:CAP domain-containing protein n=1 Tax=Streptomyces sp. NPDC046876 TaxID=3155616 RepID=UPI0033E999C6
MQKHRKKKKHYRKIAIAVGALGIVGIPTAAMACLAPQETVHARHAGRGEWHPRHGHGYGAPWATPGSEAPVVPVAESSSPAPAESSPEATEQPVVQISRAPQQPSAKPTTVSTKPQAPVAPKPVAAPASPAPASPATASGAVAEVLALVNKERAAAGCPAVTLNAQLTKAAQDHSTDMAQHATMSHTGSDGSDPGQRITAAGYTWSSYGENVAYGYSTPAQVMDGWMNSPGHRRNILDCSYKEIGIGLAQPNSYWTQDFGSAR